MSLSRIAALGVLGLALAAGTLQAEQVRRGTGQTHGSRHAIRTTPRPGPGIATYPRRFPSIFRVPSTGPIRPRWTFPPVYRPGLSVGILFGSPYGYRNRYSYRHRNQYRNPYPYQYQYHFQYQYPHDQYRYPRAYAWPYLWPYVYPGATVVYAPPSRKAEYGGVRLQVSPRGAAVYVDGYYVGTVDDFDGLFERVSLEPGPHHIEIQAPGFETAAFDVNVLPNQTIEYRGDLERLRP